MSEYGNPSSLDHPPSRQGRAGADGFLNLCRPAHTEKSPGIAVPDLAQRHRALFSLVALCI
jgi:hypothetical protein